MDSIPHRRSFMRGPWIIEVKIKIILIVSMSLLIGACATNASKKTQQLEEDWKGKNFNDLIAAKGPPDEKLDDGRGGKIFIYSAYQSEPASESRRGGSSSPGGGYGGGGGWGRHGGGYGGGGSYRRGSSKTTYLSHEMFWIDPNGYIYRASYQRKGQ
jgi:hypothetical protein